MCHPSGNTPGRARAPRPSRRRKQPRPALQAHRGPGERRAAVEAIASLGQQILGSAGQLAERSLIVRLELGIRGGSHVGAKQGEGLLFLGSPACQG